jgi:dihydrolipoamide dehydrogenase
MPDTNNKRVVVLGGGPGGYPAAFMAADHGFDVTLIDLKPNPGGVCLFQGCIPSKTLLHAAKIINETKETSAIGVTFDRPKIDIDQLRDWKNKVVGKLTGGLGSLSKQRKVNFIIGRGSFTDAHHIEVTTESGTETVEFDYAIIATGSAPTTIPGWPMDSPHLWDSTDALDLPSVPENLLVVGGGYIGLELSTVYAALGSKVTVVEATGGLLPGADRDLVEPLAARLQHTVHEILIDTKVNSVEVKDDKVHVQLLGIDLEEPNRVFDKVLVSIGRKPTAQGIGLENTAVQIDEQGFVKHDASCRTDEDHIFAIGDVAGQPMLAHKATYEARLAVQTISGTPSSFDAQAIPAVVFTDPEVAWAGITETQARTEGIPHKVARFPWAASGRATSVGRNDGLTKIIIDPYTERILGVGLVGIGAGELIAEGVLAIEMGALAKDLQMAIHAHPTLSETMMESAEVLHGQSPHYIDRKR